MEAADVGDWSERKRDNSGEPVPMPTPPPLLKLAWQCKEWDKLPYGGGILDQPYGLLDKLREVYGVWEAMKMHREAESEAEFIIKYPKEYNIVKRINNMRKEYGSSKS